MGIWLNDSINCFPLVSLHPSLPDLFLSYLLSCVSVLHPYQFAYKAAWEQLQYLHCSWKELLGLPRVMKEGRVKEDVIDDEDEEEEEEKEEEEDEEEERYSCSVMAEKQLESSITVYLRRISSSQDLSDIIKV